MALNPMIEIKQEAQILRETEQSKGSIETYRIQIKPEMEVTGWNELPDGEIDAVKIVFDGVEKYMFTVPMDNYSRSALVDLDDVLPGAELISVGTPVAHGDAIIENNERNHQQLLDERSRKADEAIARTAEEAKTRLAGINALAAHHGIEPIPKYTLAYKQLSDMIIKIEGLQNGKLDFSSLPVARPYNELPISERTNFNIFNSKILNPDVLKGIRQLSYAVEFKHDIKIDQAEDRVNISILDLKGKVLSSATLPFCLGEEVSGSYYDENEDITVEYAFIPEFISTKAHDDADVQPKIIERGRPVELENSKFAKIYESLAFMSFVPAELEHVLDGINMVKGRDQRFEFAARYQLAHMGVSKEIEELLTPKIDRNKDSGIALSA